jgi:hypothetical protein
MVRNSSLRGRYPPLSRSGLAGLQIRFQVEQCRAERQITAEIFDA